jgi:hypothetical protein
MGDEVDEVIGRLEGGLAVLLGDSDVDLAITRELVLDDLQLPILEDEVLAVVEDYRSGEPEVQVKP